MSTPFDLLYRVGILGADGRWRVEYRRVGDRAVYDDPVQRVAIERETQDALRRTEGVTLDMPFDREGWIRDPNAPSTVRDDGWVRDYTGSE